MEDGGSGSDQDAEHRRERRQRVLKGGRIVFNGGFSVLDCRIKNLNSGGAMIELESLLGIPQHFDLIVEHGKPRPCRVVWKTDRRMGVAFEDIP